MTHRSQGLTVIEVLVALALLAIISTGIIASFTLTNRLNRDASVDVDYSRVVRSVMERVKVVWVDPARWGTEEAERAEIDAAEAATIDALVAGLNSECGASILEPADIAAAAVVRVLEIRCGNPDGPVGEQVFQMEFGRP